METTRLKGGSLSGVYLCRPTDLAPFVRKTASLKVNREYGFQRWYSQLKKLQRYEQLFPGLFPRLITYGVIDDQAYFDIEYIPDSLTAHEFITTTTDRVSIDRFLRTLLGMVAQMHAIDLKSSCGPIDLYVYEEVEQRIDACMSSERFRKFVSYGDLYFNGNRVPGLVNVLDEYKSMAVSCYRSTSETFTHGNLTLENILYQPASNRVVLIDPYEENIIDSTLAEYSQICQSCSSHYELYNAGRPEIEANRLEFRLKPNEGLAYFDDAFTHFLRSKHDEYDIRMIRLFEVSQYARMLPFKMEIDQDMMLFFYGLGSYLFHILSQEASSAS